MLVINIENKTQAHLNSFLCTCPWTSINLTWILYFAIPRSLYCTQLVYLLTRPNLNFVRFYNITTLNYFQAITDEQKAEIHSKFVEVGKECLNDNPLSADDVMAFKDKKFPAGENAGCFAACVFRNVGIVSALYYLIYCSKLALNTSFAWRIGGRSKL